jgi:hypothetical protein
MTSLTDLSLNPQQTPRIRVQAARMTPFPFVVKVGVRATACTLLVASLVACGGSGGSTSKVASLDSTGGGAAAATSTTLSKKAQQDAILSYAACMRQNGVDMKDPTFDADGNVTAGGGGIRAQGLDPRSTTFQTAQKACGTIIQGIDFGAGRRRNFDPTKLQAAFNDFTSCLRDKGVQVNDITIGQGRNGGGNGGGNAGGGGLGGGNGGGAPDGSVPPGGFNGPPPSFPAGGGNAPGGAGFDPTTRLIQRLGLDATDPKVKAALSSCQPALLAAFQNVTGSTTTTTG